MKTLVFQVNIKPNGVKTSGRKRFTYSNSLYDFSNRRAEEYANQVGADYFCLSNTDWLGDNYAPCYHKLYIYEAEYGLSEISKTNNGVKILGQTLLDMAQDEYKEDNSQFNFF